MIRSYSQLGYVIIGLAAAAVLYTNVGELMASISENFEIDIYIVYFVTIFILWGIFSYISKIVLLFLKSIIREKKIKEKRERKVITISLKNTELRWVYRFLFHMLISVIITAGVYTYYGGQIITVAEKVDSPTIFIYIVIVVGSFLLVRFLSKPVIWIFAGNRGL